ncbi:MAG: hypothetical protein WCF18_03995 [Chthoniobacteraceae bacterium]
MNTPAPGQSAAQQESGAATPAKSGTGGTYPAQDTKTYPKTEPVH